MFCIQKLIKSSTVVALFVATLVSIPFNSRVNVLAQAANENSTISQSQNNPQNNPANSADAEKKMNEEKARIMKENQNPNIPSSTSDVSVSSDIKITSEATGSIKPQTTSGYPVLVIDNNYNIPNTMYCLDWHNSSGATTGSYLLTTSTPQTTAFPTGEAYDFDTSLFIPTSQISNYNYPRLRMFNVSSLLPGTLTSDICAGITNAAEVRSLTVFLYMNKTTTVYPTSSSTFLDTYPIADNEQNILPQLNIGSGSCNPSTVDYAENVNVSGLSKAISNSVCTFPLQNIASGKTPVLTSWWSLIMKPQYGNYCDLSSDRLNLICDIFSGNYLSNEVNGVTQNITIGVSDYSDPNSYFKSPTVGTITYNKVNFVPTHYLTWNDTISGNHSWTLVANPSTTDSVRLRIQVGGLNPFYNEDEFYTIPAGGRITPEFPNLMTGPIIVSTENLAPVIVTQRVLVKTAQGDSFNEYAGIPASSLTNHYYFTWNDTTNGNGSWTLVANPPNATVSANVTIKIAGNTTATKTLAPGEIWTPMVNNLMGGPVEVISDQNVIATQRSLYTYLGKQSFNEYPGIAANSLDTNYTFTWNDTTGGNNAWTLVGNPSTTTAANVTIKIGGKLVASQAVAPQTSWTPLIPNLMGGPVQVISDIPIFTTQRVLFNKTFNEFAGIKTNSLTNNYTFTWNDTTGGNSTWTLVSNLSTTQSANVTIKIAGNTTATKTLAPGEIWTPMVNNLMGGPVQVISDNPVVTTQRVLYNGFFNELAGM